MNVLVTAGNTLVPIDRVRCLTNIFTGRTGARIASHAYQQGHTVTLLTSHPEGVAQLITPEAQPDARWTVQPYRTFDDLHQLMQDALGQGGVDALIHCAAVSDYRASGIYAPAPGIRFDADDGHWQAPPHLLPALVDRTAPKVKSDEPELWLRLVRTPKLVDWVRKPWSFRGVLVKFKLEVGVSEERLLEIAEQSRCRSAADLMVANTLEGVDSWAYLGPLQGRYRRVSREELPGDLLEAVHALHLERHHG